MNADAPKKAKSYDQQPEKKDGEQRTDCSDGDL